MPNVWGKSDPPSDDAEKLLAAVLLLGPKPDPKGGAVYIDFVIDATLDLCFKDAPKIILSKDRARKLFHYALKSNVLYTGKLKILEQSYDLRLGLLTNLHMQELVLPAPNFDDLARLYYFFIKRTLLDENITSTALVSNSLNGECPRLYVLCYLLSSLSSPRSYNDQLIVPSFCGKSSCGKTKLLEPFTDYAKTVAFEADGVSRWEVKDFQNSLYFNDFNYETLFLRQNLQVVKNVLRAEPCTVKVFGSVQDLKPLYVFMTTNQCMLRHKIIKSGLATIENQISVKSNQGPDLEALKNRIIEIYFKRRARVDEAIFNYKIKPQHARVAISILLLELFAKCQHPLKYASQFLIPSTLKGMEFCSPLIASCLGVETEKIEEKIAHYKNIYVKHVSLPLNQRKCEQRDNYFDDDDDDNCNNNALSTMSSFAQWPTNLEI